MQDLVTIGRFSEMTGLTIKALRLCDKLDVLHSAVVDFSSGYRYYSLHQVAIAKRIHLLRTLDTPLDEICTLLIIERHCQVQAVGHDAGSFGCSLERTTEDRVGWILLRDPVGGSSRLAATQIRQREVCSSFMPSLDIGHRLTMSDQQNLHAASHSRQRTASRCSTASAPADLPDCRASRRSGGTRRELRLDLKFEKPV